VSHRHNNKLPSYETHSLAQCIVLCGNEYKMNNTCYVVFLIGETITVLAKINNSSSSEMTPKFRLGKKVIYRASGSTKREESTIIKVVENRIQAHTELEVRCIMKIPLDQTTTIQNCDILSVEYHLKVGNSVSLL